LILNALLVLLKS